MSQLVFKKYSLLTQILNTFASFSLMNLEVVSVSYLGDVGVGVVSLILIACCLKLCVDLFLSSTFGDGMSEY